MDRMLMDLLFLEERGFVSLIKPRLHFLDCVAAVVACALAHYMTDSLAQNEM